MTKTQVEVGDKICVYYNGNPTSITEIKDVTATEAIDKKGNKFKRNITPSGYGSYYLETVNFIVFPIVYCFCEGEELAKFQSAINRIPIISHIDNAYVTVKNSGFSGVSEEALTALSTALSDMIKVISKM